MTKLVVFAIAALGVCAGAKADIWTWVDDEGKTHYVDTNRPIWYWRDANGQIYYSDRPEHENAIRVAVVWHSGEDWNGSSQASAEQAERSPPDPEEGDEERRQREIAEAYYCNEAREIYETYSNAPRLFKTTDSGERVYLTVQEAADEIGKAEEQVERLCGAKS